jgi:hypothetical protein
MSNRIATVTPDDGLNLRTAPSTDAQALGLLKKGQQVTILGAMGRWRRVESPLGTGFVHGDFITVDGLHAVADDPAGLDPVITDGPVTPPAAATYTVAAGDTLSGIGAKLGLDWRAIAAANGLISPYTLSLGQELRLPGAVVSRAVAAGTIEVLNPLNGSTLVTSSSNQGHHTPFGGNRSCDIARLGGSSAGLPAFFNVAAPAGIEVRGLVEVIGFACRSALLDDGGHKVQLQLQQRAPGGGWQDSGAWVVYAHIDPVMVAAGDIVSPGQQFGTLGKPDGSDYNSSCAEGSHTHVEAPNSAWVVDEGTHIDRSAVLRIAIQ